MQFMQMAPMQKNNSQQQMMQLLQTTLARGGKVGAPATPQAGQVMPGGAMNIVPPATGSLMPGQGMGMLGNILDKMKAAGAQPGAPLIEPTANSGLDSASAIY